jgi:uncharacterized membrane protein
MVRRLRRVDRHPADRVFDLASVFGATAVGISVAVVMVVTMMSIATMPRTFMRVPGMLVVVAGMMPIMRVLMPVPAMVLVLVHEALRGLRQSSRYARRQDGGHDLRRRLMPGARR